jgi:hypothetical protein
MLSHLSTSHRVLRQWRKRKEWAPMSSNRCMWYISIHVHTHDMKPRTHTSMYSRTRAHALTSFEHDWVASAHESLRHKSILYAEFFTHVPRSRRHDPTLCVRSVLRLHALVGSNHVLSSRRERQEHATRHVCRHIYSCSTHIHAASGVLLLGCW